MGDLVKTEAAGPVWEITLDRPKANAISADVSRALADAFTAFRDAPEARVVILTGGGEKFFSAGWDLKAAAAGEEADADHGEGGFAGLTELWSLDKPVIAAVNGYAAGGGFELALAADMIVAADHAQFMLPEATLGIIADAGGFIRLPRRIPRAIANEMLFTGRRMPAEEAKHWGLVNRVVPLAELMEAARELAAQVCRCAPLALRGAKAAMSATEMLKVEEAYALIRSGKVPAYEAIFSSDDAKEGPLAFAEGREPKWSGH
ncbi:MAG: crotonobetainyl-CoA hydratase [Alphaproteobacteria bacterium]|nr:crotonobetainyl-CoA hydratase [Alphaproteobacteria bacterium]